MSVTSIIKSPIILHQHIREKPSEYSKTAIDHDQLFKQLINHFFKDFLKAFFPQVHDHIDFSAIKPLSEEVYTDLLEGKNRKLDIVTETKLKGKETVLLIHVEPQSYREKDFHQRMYHYFSLLYNKYRKPIVPIAVFSYDEIHDEKDTFSITFPFIHVLDFHFLKLELKKKNWRDYIESDNPAAAALLAKMGYKEEEKIQVKKEFLKMLVRMEQNPAASRFINDFFEIYLKLEKAEEEQLMEEIQKLDNAEDFMKLPNSWERRGLEKGKMEEKQKMAIRLLEKGLPVELIEEVTDLSQQEIKKLREE